MASATENLKGKTKTFVFPFTIAGQLNFEIDMVKCYPVWIYTITIKPAWNVVKH